MRPDAVLEDPHEVVGVQHGRHGVDADQVHALGATHKRDRTPLPISAPPTRIDNLWPLAADVVVEEDLVEATAPVASPPLLLLLLTTMHQPAKREQMELSPCWRPSEKQRE